MCGLRGVLALVATAVLAPAARADPTVEWKSFPSDQVELEATSAQGAAATYSLPTAAIGDRELLVTCKPAPGSVVPLGETKVACIAADPRKLVELASRSFRIVVRDTTVPAFSDVPAQIEREASSRTTPVRFEPPKAKDVVSGNVPVTCTPASGAAFPLGQTTVTCTAKDDAGNAASVAFSVRLMDTSPPVFSNAPDLRVEATGRLTRVTYDQPSAADAVDGTVAVACSPATGSEFPLGQASITCTARDERGNEATNRFRLSVLDTTAPALTLPSASTVRAVSEVAASDEPVATVLAQVRATDLVDGAVEVTNDAPLVFVFGTTTVHFTATDRAGNVARASFPITLLGLARAGAGTDVVASPRIAPRRVGESEEAVGRSGTRQRLAGDARTRPTTATAKTKARRADAPPRSSRATPRSSGVQSGSKPVTSAEAPARDDRPASAKHRGKARRAVEGIASGLSAVPRHASRGPFGLVLTALVVLSCVAGLVWAAARGLRRLPGEGGGASPLASDVLGVPPAADARTSAAQCEIVLWRGYARSRFYAVVTDENGDQHALAASRPLKAPRGDVGAGADPAFASAYAELLEQLSADGWQVAASDQPFETTLVRDVAC
jgi:hypothetical protein